MFAFFLTRIFSTFLQCSVIKHFFLRRCLRVLSERKPHYSHSHITEWAGLSERQGHTGGTNPACTRARLPLLSGPFHSVSRSCARQHLNGGAECSPFNIGCKYQQKCPSEYTRRGEEWEGPWCNVTFSCCWPTTSLDAVLSTALTVVQGLLLPWWKYC